MQKVNEALNYVFSAIFAIEIVIKFIAYDWMFFKDGWNNFDLVNVIGSVIGLILTLFNIDGAASMLVLRAFRICRMFKLFRHLKSLMLLSNALMVSIPALQNIMYLLGLIMYIYSVLGMFLFAEVMEVDPINDMINFKTIGTSLLTMFRVATGENWQDIMYSLSREKHYLYDCKKDPTYK